jgi:hypothetical protein
MEKKLYWVWDNENNANLSMFETENTLPYNNENFVKPIYSNGQIIERATPEEIAEQENQQKQELKKILKQQQYEELLPTDWYVVRFIETGIEIPEEILQQRQAIREKYE